VEITFRDQKVSLPKALLAALIVFFLYRVSDLLTPFFLAAALTYFLYPAVEFFHRRRLARITAIILVYFLVFGLLTLALFFLVPPLFSQLYRLTDALPDYSAQIQQFIDYAEARYSQIDLPDSLRLALDRKIRQGETFFLATVDNTINGFFSLFRNLINFIIAPIFSFYLLKDTEAIKKSFYGLFPAKQRPQVSRLVAESNRILSNYFRGQLLVSLILAAMTTAAYLIMHVRFALLWGVIAGLLNIIPYVGPIVAALPPIAIALFSSTHLAVVVVIVNVVLQQIEGYAIRPRIMESSVGLHPLIIIFSVLVGGKFFGITGMFLAIPLVGIGRVLLRHNIKEIIASLW